MQVSDPAPQPMPPLAVPVPIESAPPRPAPTIPYSASNYNPNIRILYLRTHEEANRELAKLGSGPQVLGFDLEWKPNFIKGARENPVALVQLSNHDIVFLLQITAMKEFPSKLEQILANPSIVKTGVAIQGDAKKIYSDCHVPMYNCVDLSLLARTVDNARWKGKYSNPLGLARLIETYEDRLLPKGRTTRSNWEANLNDLQIEYASNDAHAGYVLYRKLETMIPSLQAPPKQVWYTFNFVSGHPLDSKGLSWHPQNPNYDPGPPPPPRIPKEPKATDIIIVEEVVSQTIVESSKPSSRMRFSDEPNLPRVYVANLRRVEVERRSRNTLPSHPYGAAYQEQTQSREGSPAAQQLPNRNRVHQQRPNDNVDHDLHPSSSSSSSSLTMRTIQTQPRRAFPTATSAQSYENTLRPFGFSSSNDGGGGGGLFNDPVRGPRVDPARGPRNNSNNITTTTTTTTNNNNSQTHSERSRQARRRYHRPNHLPGQDASNS